jgi:hypothetical protein
VRRDEMAEPTAGQLACLVLPLAESWAVGMVYEWAAEWVCGTVVWMVAWKVAL